MTASPGNRRDFLSGRSALQAVQQGGGQIADRLTSAEIPARGPTLMLRTTAMATDFDVLLNPGGPSQQLTAASAALDEVARLEQQYSVYRPDSELSVLNRRASVVPSPVEPRLLELLQRGLEIARLTGGAFNPVAGRLISLWRRARNELRLPTDAEREAAVGASRWQDVHIDTATQALTLGDVASSDEPPEFNLGAIGKGYAVDQAAEILQQAEIPDWLVHGGKSSVRAQGGHAGHAGWPVALQNPLLPDRPFATLLLQNAALSTSGTAVQWFRHEGRRYGHILDPRTGQPVDSMLSVSVIAPDAALADALSTAFFVLGVENALECCDNFPEAGVILFPLPADGRTLQPVSHNLKSIRLFFRDE